VKTLLELLTALLLVVITVWHFFCAMMFIYVALMAKNPWLLGILVVVLFPPFVIIRRTVRERWTVADIVLVIIAVLPGIVLGVQMIAKPYGQNGPRVVLMLVGYVFAPVLVAIVASLDRRDGSGRASNE
jgi:FtsH-binding integral membrane protein